MRIELIGRTAVLSALALASIAGFAGPKDKFVSVPFQLSIVETSDVHGAVFPYNFIKAQPMKNSLAQVATLVARQRTDKDREVILLDAGDGIQGQPPVYYYNFVKTSSPHLWSSALNTLGYDAVTVGNHDIEAGHAVYDKLYRELKAPVVCANILKEDGSPYFRPYMTLTRQGVKIAILGMITPRIADWLPPQFWTGMQFADMVETARKWVPIIQEKEKPDLLIGLFHSGVDYSYLGANRDTLFNENSSQLVAEQVSGFDLVFVGHDHLGWDGLGWNSATKQKAEVKGPDGKPVYIFGPVDAAKRVPLVNLSMTWNKKTKTWTKKIEGSLVDMEKMEPDAAFLAKFQPVAEEVKAWVDRPIGKLAGKITTRDSMFGDSAFVDLIHRIQFELSADPAMGLKKADVSFAAPLTFDATIPTSADGTMYVRDMFNLYQYENFLYTMDLTGKQIQDFLEYSYKSWFDTMPNDGNHIIAFQKDKDGQFIKDARSGAFQTATRSYNYDSAAGIDYTVDVSKPAGSRIVITTMADGSPFDPARTYVVAINSYRGQGGGGHLTTGAGLDKPSVQKLKFVNGATTKDLRYYLLQWFEKQPAAVKVDPIGNWKVIPEGLANQGKATDMPLLYPGK